MPNPVAPTNARASSPTLRDKWESVAVGATLVVCSFSLSTYVLTRLQITAQANAYMSAGAGIWSAQVRVNTVNTIFSETQRWPAGFQGTCDWTGTTDLTPGTYTLDIKLAVDALSPAAVDFYAKYLIVRRGRKPVI